jgi:hypothetical protein
LTSQFQLEQLAQQVQLEILVQLDPKDHLV